MGVLYFFKWIKNKYFQNIIPVKKTENINMSFDNLLIDINAIIHPSCQRIFKYGNYKENKTFLKKRKEIIINVEEEISKVYEDVCQTVENLLKLVKPKKRLVLCIDGVAPISKQMQQRKRRFLSKNNDCPFDSNSITTGTLFMHNFSVYLKDYFKSKYQNLKIIFSSEKNPGEGEHKIILFLNKYIDIFENNCIHGMDADLILLSLLTNMRSIYILRDENFIRDIDYHLLSISDMRYNICNDLKFENSNPLSHISNFTFLSFLLGNDFLPPIPTLEISRNSIDKMIDVYKTNKINLLDDNFNIILDNFAIFLSDISKDEENFLKKKIKDKDYIPDIILEKSIENNTFNLEIYKDLYYFNNIPEIFNDYKIDKDEKIFDIELIRKVGYNENKVRIFIQNYIKTLQWNILYYSKKQTIWNHKYNYTYSPFLSTILQYLPDIIINQNEQDKPNSQFLQLLSVLPPSSFNLIPSPISKLKDESIFQSFSPNNVSVDCSGKKNEWEGIVKLPNPDMDYIRDFYENNIQNVKKEHLHLNSFHKNLLIYKNKEKIIDF